MENRSQVFSFLCKNLQFSNGGQGDYISWQDEYIEDDYFNDDKIKALLKMESDGYYINDYNLKNIYVEFDDKLEEDKEFDNWNDLKKYYINKHIGQDIWYKIKNDIKKVWEYL